MAKTIVHGYTDTAIAGNPAMSVTVGKYNFPTDFRVVSDVPGETRLVNITCPVDQPETLRFSQRKVANIYKGAPDIDPSAYLPVKNGTATLMETQVTWSEEDSVTGGRLLFPLRVGTIVTVPSYGGISDAEVLNLVLRSFGLPFQTGTVTSAGLAALIRGVMRKSDL